MIIKVAYSSSQKSIPSIKLDEASALSKKIEMDILEMESILTNIGLTSKGSNIFDVLKMCSVVDFEKLPMHVKRRLAVQYRLWQFMKFQRRPS